VIAHLLFLNRAYIGRFQAFLRPLSSTTIVYVFAS
jgi:hypothetical protein